MCLDRLHMLYILYIIVSLCIFLSALLLWRIAVKIYSFVSSSRKGIIRPSMVNYR